MVQVSMGRSDFWIGLKERPRTGPAWVVFRKMRESESAEEPAAMILAGSQRVSSPFSLPAARIPCGRAVSLV